MAHLKRLTLVQRIGVLLVFLAAALVAGLVISAADDSPFGPKQYSAPAASFRIVDENGQPIGGAVALMTWTSMENTHTSKVLDVMEVEADADGVIRVPAWGPITTPFGTRMLPNVPDLRVFKPGYLPLFDQNVTGEYWEEAGPNLPLKWDGNYLVLQSADEASDRYFFQVKTLAGSLLFFSLSDQCWSVRFHRMIEVVNSELDRLTPHDTPSGKVTPNRSSCATSDPRQ